MDFNELRHLNLSELQSRLKAAHDFGDNFQLRWEIDRNIFCPHCGVRQPNDDFQYPVNYHSPDEAHEEECCDCEKVFFVQEHVERTYKSAKTAEELI